MRTFENLLLEREGPVAVLTVNRPKALNALDPATLRELLQAIREVRRDATIRCVVLTGAGNRAFVAGADIAAMAAMGPIEGRAFSRLGHRVMHGFESLERPVVAAVGGFALGGGLELALACDFIVASETAEFGQPEINLGLIPGFGGTQRLVRRIGVGRAREIVYLGERIGARRALEIGLVDRVVPAEQVRDEALGLGRALAAKAPVALAQAKVAINGAPDVDLTTGCRLEVEAFTVTFASADRSEGLRAFLEKRPPTWRGT
jgi:enoyl-CoA hydratase